MTLGLPSKPKEAKRRLRSVFQVLQRRNCQLWLVYPLKLLFKNEKEIKTFSGKGK